MFSLGTSVSIPCNHKLTFISGACHTYFSSLRKEHLESLGDPENSNEERAAVETDDQFMVQDEGLNIEEDLVKEGKPSIQDLLAVAQKTNLQEALPQAITLLKLAAVTPLTSVYCERVFSRLKRIVSPARSTMQQNRKMLVFLQVEHRTLRWLSQQPNFKATVIAHFKS